MKRLRVFFASLGLVAMFGLLVPFVASAHEQRDVDNGKYHFGVGWLNEPAYSGFSIASI
jgi:hypothetical protein